MSGVRRVCALNLRRMRMKYESIRDEINDAINKKSDNQIEAVPAPRCGARCSGIAALGSVARRDESLC